MMQPSRDKEKRNKILLERAKNNVFFSHYREGSLWYCACDGWLFPVPTADLGSADANSCEKGITLMRWMRKHMDLEAQNDFGVLKE